MTTRIQAKILELLHERGSGKTICPSEVARMLYPSDWRGHMDEVRVVAVNMCEDNRLEITQKGEVVAPPFHGPIRLRLKKESK